MTQLRSELRSLLATSNAPPDFSLVPLPKPPPQGPLPPTVLAASKVPRPKPQLRQSSSLLRNTNQRRATADAVVTGRETNRRRATADAVVTSRPVSLSNKTQTTALQPMPASGKAIKPKGLLPERVLASSSKAVASSTRAVANSLSAPCNGHVSEAGQRGSSMLASSAANASSSVADAAASQDGSDANGVSLFDLTNEAADTPDGDLVLTTDQATIKGDEAGSSSRRLSKSISWPVSPSMLRDGVTQNGVASSSYTHRCASAMLPHPMVSLRRFWSWIHV